MGSAQVRSIAVIGLGYVGLPVAVHFGKKHASYAFDINEDRIKELRDGYDRTGEVNSDDLKSSDLVITSDIQRIKDADFYIVAVPTPIDDSKNPNLAALKGASELVGSVLSKGDIVVFESTVFPGATEEICAPILQSISKLDRENFKVGYSPERINPGDKEHTFSKITKVVSGEDKESLEIIADVYSSVVDAGVYRASSIKVAEAAKVIENTQRDLNISLMNELSLIFHRMDIDTNEVINAAATKWNFLPFRPGLVGGHCIGVDPYYLTYRSESFGYTPQVILSGRRVNDNMGKFVAEQTVKEMVKSNILTSDSRVAVMGLTFKENCPDIRNSKVIDIIRELESYGLDILALDSRAEVLEVKKNYGLDLVDVSDLKNIDVIILAVGHDEYKDLSSDQLDSFCNSGALLVDVKSVRPSNEDYKNISKVWRL